VQSSARVSEIDQLSPLQPIYVHNRSIVIKSPAMRSKLLILTLLLLLAGANIIRAQDEVSDLLGRVNNLRASVGRAPYTLNGALSAAAQNQAQWIVETGNVSHTRPDGSGPRTRALNAGYPSVQVSENIYGGTNAGVDSAWVFWINSGIHYAGLVNAAYNDVGIGAAHGSWGAAYVMVFGNSGGPPPPPPQSAGSNSSGNNNASSSAASAPPSYVMGLDENGNIMHQVQQGDTLGDIALIYGYTWDDLPAMMALNGLTDVHDLEVGSIFLVPSRENMSAAAAEPASDIPNVAMLATPENPPTRTPIPATITPYVALLPMREATLVVTPLEMMTAMPTPAGVATVGDSALPAMLAQVSTTAPTPQGTQIAQVATDAPLNVASAAPLPVRSNSTQWIVIAVVVQLFVLVVAGVEYTRRARRKKR
jgi:uncharacterized protein YkwD